MSSKNTKKRYISNLSSDNESTELKHKHIHRRYRSRSSSLSHIYRSRKRFRRSSSRSRSKSPHKDLSKETPLALLEHRWKIAKKMKKTLHKKDSKKLQTSSRKDKKHIRLKGDKTWENALSSSSSELDSENDQDTSMRQKPNTSVLANIITDTLIDNRTKDEIQIDAARDAYFHLTKDKKTNSNVRLISEFISSKDMFSRVDQFYDEILRNEDEFSDKEEDAETMKSWHKFRQNKLEKLKKKRELQQKEEEQQKRIKNMKRALEIKKQRELDEILWQEQERCKTESEKLLNCDETSTKTSCSSKFRFKTDKSVASDYSNQNWNEDHYQETPSGFRLPKFLQTSSQSQDFGLNNEAASDKIVCNSSSSSVKLDQCLPLQKSQYSAQFAMPYDNGFSLNKMTSIRKEKHDKNLDDIGHENTLYNEEQNQCIEENNILPNIQERNRISFNLIDKQVNKQKQGLMDSIPDGSATINEGKVED